MSVLKRSLVFIRETTSNERASLSTLHGRAVTFLAASSAPPIILLDVFGSVPACQPNSFSHGSIYASEYFHFRSSSSTPPPVQKAACSSGDICSYGVREVLSVPLPCKDQSAPSRFLLKFP